MRNQAFQPAFAGYLAGSPLAQPLSARRQGRMPEATLREQGVEKWNWRKALRAYKKDAVFRRKGIVT
jgi:hypothetical protein